MTTVDFSSYNHKEEYSINQIMAEISSGKDVYVKVKTGAHTNSIGKVHKVINTGSAYTSYNRKYYIQFSIKFDDRKNILKPTLNKLAWVVDHTGPTVWKYKKIEKAEPVKKETSDRFGNELSEGNTVLYAYNQGRGKGPTVLIGRISKITPRGTIYCQPFSFTKGDIWQNEMRITTNSHLIKVDEHLQDRILMAKLSE